MIQQKTIQLVIDTQREQISHRGIGMEREALSQMDVVPNFATIISGIRRCGKSVLLTQIMKKTNMRSLFLNFDDPRLAGFEMQDFRLVDNIVTENKYEALFFDEMQVIQGWELYIRQKLDEGFIVYVTGSNATLLSRELGTKLTGRHITKELFPFSYKEFLSFNKLINSELSFRKYFKTGGFPEFLKTKNTDILLTLFSDVLLRDVVVHHGIRDVASLNRLAVYLVSNAGNLVTASKLQKQLGIKTSTMLEYFSFLEDAYLVSFVPRFRYSYKAQLINPRKIYVIDPGIIEVVSASFTNDYGKRLENIVYLHFRRCKDNTIYYFNENGNECDFVVMNKGACKQVVQVCWELTPENVIREQQGLKKAMDFFKTKNGCIITYNQSDAYMQDGQMIEVIPAWKFING